MKALITLLIILLPMGIMAHHGHGHQHDQEHVTMYAVFIILGLLILGLTKPARKFIANLIKQNK